MKALGSNKSSKEAINIYCWNSIYYYFTQLKWFLKISIIIWHWNILGYLYETTTFILAPPKKKENFVPKTLLHYFGMRLFPSIELHPKTLIYILKKCSIYGGKTIYAKFACNVLLFNGWKFAWKLIELFLMDNLTSYILILVFFSTRRVFWTKIQVQKWEANILLKNKKSKKNQS